MRTVLTILIAALVCVACIGGPAFAQLTPTEWTALGETTSWFDEDNWDEGVPTSGHHATIPHNPDGGSVWPVVDDPNTNARAGKLTITVSGGTRGSLNVNHGCTLILGSGTQTSYIHGDVFVGDAEGAGTIEVKGAHTILGNGGTILLQRLSEINPANASGDSLTIGSSATPCTQRSCSLVLHGYGVINVELDNRAYVVADEKLMNLEEAPKTGTSAGTWTAEGSAILNVSTQVTGACAWKLVDLTSGGKINLTDSPRGCVRASGPVTLLSGTLHCEAGQGENPRVVFCTSGKLTWKSTFNGSFWTQPRIATMSANSSASFGLDSEELCATCP